jgi:hypothetical protein
MGVERPPQDERDRAGVDRPESDGPQGLSLRLVRSGLVPPREIWLIAEPGSWPIVRRLLRDPESSSSPSMYFIAMKYVPSSQPAP